MLLPVCVWGRCTYVSLWVCMCPCMCPWCIWKGYITLHIIFSETGSLAGLQFTICFEWLGSKLLGSCCFLPSVRSQAWTAILGFWLGAQGPDLDPHAWIANTLPTEPSHQVNQHCQILMPIIQIRKLRFHTWLYPQVAEWLEKVTHHLRFEILYSWVRIISKHPEPPILNEK